MRLPGSKITGDNKVSFRVWAPLAASVDIVGDFNNWKEYQSPLADAGEGYWEGVIDNISKLDYVKSMGFNAIQILPVQEFRGDRSWGYNPSFYYALASSYGKPYDLRNFVNECHKRGIAVIFDVVYNHISNIDSSFWHFDDETVNSYLSTFETPWGLSPAFWQNALISVTETLTLTHGTL